MNAPHEQQVHQPSSSEQRALPPRLQALRRFALISFIGAGVLTVALLAISVAVSDAAAERLSLAGDLAGGAAAAWAFVVAAVALRIADANSEHERVEAQRDARLLLQLDIDSQFHLQRAERAFDVYMACVRMRQALERVFYAVEAELGAAVAGAALGPDQRPLTCDALQSWMAAVETADATGALTLTSLTSDRLLFTNDNGRVECDIALSHSLADLIRNLSVFAAGDLRAAAPGLGARWQPVEWLHQLHGEDMPAGFLFSADPTSEPLSMPQVVMDELGRLTQEEILADWGTLSFDLAGKDQVEVERVATVQRS